MELISRFALLSALLLIVGCNVSGADPEEKKQVIADVSVEENKSTNRLQSAGAARLIDLGAPPGSLLPELLLLAEEAPTPEITISESADGTVTAEVGNLFSRPLVVKTDCEGNLVKSHSDVASVLKHEPTCDNGEAK